MEPKKESKMRFSGEKRRDAVKFLMGLGTNPSLTPADQRYLSEMLRGPFANGMTEKIAIRAIDSMNGVVNAID
jgi:hypothetical protein